ncbi:MAG: hypothetical protein WBW49_23185, partial [Candidatus Acidiferrum sp.]
MSDPGGFNDWRTALALGKSRGLFFVSVNPAERLAIRVIYGYEEVMVTTTTVFSEFGLLVPHSLSRRFACCFSHRIFLDILKPFKCDYYRKNLIFAQVQERRFHFSDLKKFRLSDTYHFQTNTPDNENIIECSGRVYWLVYV